jgi:hypothetical protein
MLRRCCCLPLLLSAIVVVSAWTTPSKQGAMPTTLVVTASDGQPRQVKVKDAG